MTFPVSQETGQEADGAGVPVLMPGMARLSRTSLLLGMIVLLLFSGMALSALGVRYILPGGPFPEKIHPGTYFIYLAFVLLLCSRGNPMTAMLTLVRRYPDVLTICLCIGLAVLYILGRDGGGATQSGLALVETYVPASLTAVMLLEAPDRYRRRCFSFLTAIVLANTTLAIFETLTETRLTPYLVVAEEGELIESQFRPSAFFGHPLDNALITALFMLSFLGVPQPPLRKLAIVSFLVIGLLAAGGRTSMVVGLVLLCVWALVKAPGFILSGRASYRGVLIGLVTVIVLPTSLLTGAVVAGIGERILANLYWDESANTRSLLFRVFDYISVEQLLFGVSTETWTEIKAQAAINWGVFEIENFWIIILCSLGVVVFTIFAVGLICFIWSIWRRCGFAVRLAIALLVIVGSSNNSLATKTKNLTLFVAFTLSAETRIRVPHPELARRRGEPLEPVWPQA